MGQRRVDRASDTEIVLGLIATNGAGVLGLVVMAHGGVFVLLGLLLIGFFVFGWSRAFNSDLPWRKL